MSFEVVNMIKQHVLCLVLTVFSLNILYFVSSENVQLFRYTKAVCSSSNISVTNYYCFVKAYSRTITTISFGGNLIKNYTKIYYEQTMEYKYGTVFREVMKTGRIEVCEILESIFGKKPKKNQRFEPINIILNMTYKIGEDTMNPTNYHPCPYYGSFKANNISMDNAKFFSIFPSGEYRVTQFYSSDKDPKIFELKFWHTVKSPIKTSF